MVDNSDRQQIVNMADQDYTYTEQLGLALYGDETPADFRNGHNFNMRELDKDYGEIKQTAQTGVDAAKKAQDDVNNVQAQLNGLSIDSVQDAQNLLAKIENTEAKTVTNANSITVLDTKKANAADVYTKTQSDARYELREENSHVIWMGDSITAGSGVTAAEKFTTLINTFYKFTPHDYSKGGAGWIHAADSGNLATFPLQAQTAIGDDSFDHNSIAKIFILGGVNDFPSNSTEGHNIYAGVRGTLKNLLEEFPNATIYVGAFLGGELSSTHSIANGWNRDKVVRKQILRGVLAAEGGSRVVAADCFNWCCHSTFFYNTDLLHPNASGHKLIAGQVRQMINGGGPIRTTGPHIAGDNAFVPSDTGGRNPARRVIRFSDDASLATINITCPHVLAADEVKSSTTAEFCIGTFAGWLRSNSPYDAGAIIAGCSDGGEDGWYGGTYIRLMRNETTNAIEAWGYCKKSSGTYKAGDVITSNFSATISTLGYALDV